MENLVAVIRRDLDVLVGYGEVIARRVEGYWSVDFAMSSGKWYFIDMAIGEASWKPRKLDVLDKILLEALHSRPALPGQYPLDKYL